jgi:hypothetical protein
MSTIRVRCLLQQCTKATLRLQDESVVTVSDLGWREEGKDLIFLLEINRGMVVFVAFLKDAQLDDVNKLGNEKNQKEIILNYFEL